MKVYLVKPKSIRAKSRLAYSAPYLPSVGAYLMFDLPKGDEVDVVEVEVETQVLFEWIEEAAKHLQRRIWKQEHQLKKLYNIMNMLVRLSEELAKV